MIKPSCVVFLTLFALAAGLPLGGVVIAQEHDYYKHLRYPTKLVPGVGLDKVQPRRAGSGPNAAGYKRRTVQWWPRKGQDVVDIPKGAPLRVWTRNKGQKDPEVLAGLCRNWTTSDPQTFKAHLVAFRSFGTSTALANKWRSDPHIPAAVLRMENGELRAVVDYGVISRMLSKEDHAYIHKVWEEAYPKLYATVSQGDTPMPGGGVPGGSYGDFKFKRWQVASPKFNAIELAKDSKYPRWARSGHNLAFETPHFHLIARPTIWGGPWGQPANWVAPDDPKRQNLYRKHVMEFVENFWTYVEASGASMPYWRRFGGNYKYVVHIHGNRAAGGWGHCGVGDCSPVILGHELYHGQPTGGWDGHVIESMCNAGQHTAFPGELQMFDGNFRYPWRDVYYKPYGGSLWCFALSDNPNWGYGIQAMAGSLAGPEDWMPYHTIAMLGQKRGLWKNGVKGFGDFFGEYAARMVTCDLVEQYMIRAKYGMPEMSCVYPVYGHKNRSGSVPGLRRDTYRISNAEAPRWCGYNIIRLKAAEGAKEITVDFQGIHEPALHSDWRACIVAVDGDGRARYSPLWNKGKMAFALKPSDKHLWLTVAATPSAFPVLPSRRRGVSYYNNLLMGVHAPRYPWEVTLTGCRPGLPHRRQGDVVNLDELYGRCDGGNTYVNYSVKQEVPIPLTEPDGKLAQAKLAAMLPRIEASAKVLKERIRSGVYPDGWYESKKTMRLGDLTRRVKFLQRNAKGRRHGNGGGFVSDNSRVAKTAYVGPDAMVLDGARVEDNACIKGFAVVLGPKTVIRGNAKVGGRAWVSGDITVGGNARILEAATVSTIWREPRTPSRRHEGQAQITGSAVIKGEHFLLLCRAKDQVLTGGVVMDYTPTTDNRQSGVFKCGRWYRPRWGYFRPPALSDGVDAGALYANWQFNQPKATLLEDAYVNNNGVLHGRPEFADDGENQCIVFNGKDQYAEAPPSVADFGELTIDMLVNRSAGKGGRLFDFGTGEDECFYLAIDPRNGKPSLTALHKGKTYTLVATQGIAADKWVRVRVEMDGSKASIYIDGKNAGKGKFKFRPRDVFIGDRPEGNFIACGRNKNEFFKGRMDHFRIYRKVHDDFNAVGPPPFALTQMQEWSEKDQERSDAWAGRRRAKEAELQAGKYGQMQDKIKWLEQQKSAVYKTARLKELESRAREAEQKRNALQRKIHDAFRALPQTVKTEQEIKLLRQKMDVIVRRIRQDSAYVKLTKEMHACEKQRGEMEKEVRERPMFKTMSAKTDAANEQKRKAEERIKQLPELKKIMELSEQEKDNQKKRELLDKYNGLLAAGRASDPEWQKAEIACRRLGRRYHDNLRGELESHAGRRKMETQLQRLRENLRDLEARLRKSDPELSRLAKSVADKQTPLDARRRGAEQKARAKDEYTKAEAACAAARKAVDQERKRTQQEKSKEAGKVAARIEKLKKESKALLDSALKTAGCFGPNPYPGREAAELLKIQQNVEYHTTADWEHRTPEEVRGEIPAKMKKWLKRVRGY